MGGGPAGVVDAKLKGLLGAGVVDPRLGVLEAAPPKRPPDAGLFNPENIPPVGVAGLFSVVGVEAPSALGPPKLKPPPPPPEDVAVPAPPNNPPPAEVVGVVLEAGFAPKLKADAAFGAFPVLWPKILPPAGLAAPVFDAAVFDAPAFPNNGVCPPAGFAPKGLAAADPPPAPPPNRDEVAGPDVAGAPPKSPGPELLGVLLELPPPNIPPPVFPVLPNVNPDIFLWILFLLNF